MRALGGMSAVLVSLLGASTALAQDVPDSTPPPTTTQPATTDATQLATPPVELTPAERAFEQGRALLDEGKYEEACVQFDASLKIDPDAPGTMLNLGLCHEHLGHTATALVWFRKAQFRAVETHKPDYEAAAKHRAHLLAGHVATIHGVLANPPPPGATFVLDTQTLSELDLAHAEVDAGHHTLEMRVQGRPPIHVEFDIVDGDALDVRVPVPAPQKKIVVIDRGATQRQLSYFVGGAGVSLYVASAALTIISKHELDASEHPEDKFYWRDVARWGGTPLFALGTVGLVAATYLYVHAPRKERVEQTVFAPTVDTHGLGVAVHGSF